MKGTITKIDEPKSSRNGNTYIRVHFKMEDGSWAKTDLCPDYRNYSRWRYLLKVGVALTGLSIKCDKAVDADSYPKAIFEKKPGKWLMNDNGDMEFVEEKIEEIKIDPIKATGIKQLKLIK